VKIGIIVRPKAQGINQRIKESKQRMAIGLRLLVDQGHVACPEWGRKAGSAN